MPAPALLVLGAAGFGLLATALRRWRIAQTAVGMAALLLQLSILVSSPLAGQRLTSAGGLQPEWVLFGRDLSLTAGVQAALLFAGLALLALFALSLFFSQGTGFVPLTLAAYGGLAGAIMVRPLLFGATILLAISGLTAVLIQGGRVGSTLAAVRVVTMGALATALLLVAGWLVEADPGGTVVALSQIVAVAFVILLAGFPFHIWVAPAVQQARSLVPAAIFGPVQFLLIVFCLAMLAGAPAVPRNAAFTQLLLLSGLATALTGGSLALLNRSFAGLIGNVLLVDIGAMLLSFALGGLEVAETALSLAGARTIGLVVAGTGLAMVRRHFDRERPPADEFAANRGLFWRAPLGVSLYLLGGLSLAGLPLTAGYAGRYAVLVLVGEQSPLAAVVMALATGAAAVALLWRSAPLVFVPPDGRRLEDVDTVPRKIGAAAILAMAIILGLFPALLPRLFGSVATLF